MTKTNDEIMQDLLTAKRKGTKIFYGPEAAKRTTPVEYDHTWDLNNNMYLICHRREYIISISDRDKNNPIIEYTDNRWTRSDFGKTETGEFILMREVYPEEME